MKKTVGIKSETFYALVRLYKAGAKYVSRGDLNAAVGRALHRLVTNDSTSNVTQRLIKGACPGLRCDSNGWWLSEQFPCGLEQLEKYHQAGMREQKRATDRKQGNNVAVAGGLFPTEAANVAPFDYFEGLQTMDSWVGNAMGRRLVERLSGANRADVDKLTTYQQAFVFKVRGGMFDNAPFGGQFPTLRQIGFMAQLVCYLDDFESRK